MSQNQDSKVNFPCSLVDQQPVKQIDRGLYTRLHHDGRKLIQGWFDRAKRVCERNYENTFEAFIFTWISLNGWGACVAETDGDRKWVEAVAFDDELSQLFQKFLKADPNFKSQAELFKSFWPIFKASEIRRKSLRFADDKAPRKEFVDYYLANGFTKFEPQCWLDHNRLAPLDWPHTMLTLYRVRCNLFHGEKSRHSEMDNSIVNASFLLLSMFIEKTSLFETSSRPRINKTLPVKRV